FRVSNEEEAEACLRLLKEAHPKASHHCYAWRNSGSVPIERFSDDGEPSGTAGRPILEILKRRDVQCVLVIVTRYFGGTLLGASGLVHAYSEAAVAALDQATLIRCEPYVDILVECSYGEYGRIDRMIQVEKVSVHWRNFGENVSMCLVIPDKEQELWQEKLRDLTNGQATLQVSPARLVGILPGGQLCLDDLLPANDKSAT
ncbi:MAG: YigZ family protein, partial [Firmicutes bacterium]|nr:YigZ family protein [Bacillota bacterium]